ncbi:hypothetical protein SLS54_008981 [Diplodia seriata]
MRATTLLGPATLIFVATAAACSTQSTRITFYGAPDNDPPGSTETAFSCDLVSSRGNNAGGTGAFDDPLTFATATGEFEPCEVIYIPYLQKYGINQDFCAQCNEDWGSGTWHIDIWTGDSYDGGEVQTDCEESLTPDDNQSIVRSPPDNLPVDTIALFDYGQCNVDHTYNGNEASCDA